MQCVYCVIWYMCRHGILQSIMTSSNRSIFHVTLLLFAEPLITVDSPHKGTITRTFDISLLAIWTDCWTNIRLAGNWDAMTVTWRRLNALSSLISLTTQLFVQHLVRVYIKENTKAPHQCPCLRIIHLSLVTAGFPLLSTSNTHIVYMTWCHYAKWSIHVHGSVNWVMTGSRNVLDPVMCEVITLTNVVSFVWNKIQYNDITNISSWKKLQGRLQGISAILTQPHWVDTYFICTYEE